MSSGIEFVDGQYVVSRFEDRGVRFIVDRLEIDEKGHYTGNLQVEVKRDGRWETLYYAPAKLSSAPGQAKVAHELASLWSDVDLGAWHEMVKKAWELIQAYRKHGAALPEPPEEHPSLEIVDGRYVVRLFESKGVRLTLDRPRLSRNGHLRGRLQVEVVRGPQWVKILDTVTSYTDLRDRKEIAETLYKVHPFPIDTWLGIVERSFQMVREAEDAERLASGTQRWSPVPITELSGDDTEVRWVWEGLLARGHLTDFYALWKSGKTTLVAALLRQMETGGELAGKAVQAGKALVVTEEAKAKWAERREEFGLGDHVHIITRPFPKQATWEGWEAFADYLAGLVAERGYDLVVFDALPHLWPVKDENNAPEVVAALLPLQAVADAGCAVLLVRHPRKSDGGQGTAGRGSGAISAFVDIIIEMRRYEPEQQDDTRRVLTVYSRYEPFEVIIRWNGGADYETLGSPAAYSAEAQRQQLLDVLAEHGQATTGELAKAVGLPHATASKRLKELQEAGLVRREGSGKKGDPYRWTLADGSGETPDTEFVSPYIDKERGETNSGGGSAETEGGGGTEFVSPRFLHGNKRGEMELGNGSKRGSEFFSPRSLSIGGEKKSGVGQEGDGQLSMGELVNSVTSAESPASRPICVDCGKPIEDPRFVMRCPHCLKAAYDREPLLKMSGYPSHLMDWLAEHGER
ncbi:AAA family ATPase [Thermoflexus sp.]|uniref:AAA family ATPase n=1 Tax=Thermoflexus sp. TaxID=1969742 RepID=UPI0035E42706